MFKQRVWSLAAPFFIGALLVGLFLFVLDAVPSMGKSAVVDGQLDAAYSTALAVDPDDLDSGIESWVGTQWTEVFSLYVTNDTQNLYVFVPLPAYSHTQSSGSLGLVIATAKYTTTSGTQGDPWGNAITFAYSTTYANQGATPVVLPHRIIPDVIIRGNIVGSGGSDNGWTELRKWNGSDYGTGGGTNWGGLSGGSMVSQRMAFADGQGLEFSIPLSDLGLSYVPGTPVHLQFYATQTGGSKGVYDTVPDDDQSVGWDDSTTQQVLATYTLVSDQGVAIVSPTENEHFVTPNINVTGYVTPTGQVTLTLSINGVQTLTPTLDANGYFTQAVSLTPGVNTITATADGAAGVGVAVRHVTYGAAAHDGDIWWGCLGHNTHDLTYRDPFGARPTDATVTLRLRACKGDLTGAMLHVYLHERGEVAALPMSVSAVITDAVYDYWEATVTTPITPTLMYYKFEAVDGADRDWYVDDTGYDGRNGWGRAVDENPTYDAFRITVYDQDFQTPDWVKDAVIYQIFPDRFRDGDPSNNVVSGTHFIYGNASGGITYTTWNAPVINPRDPADPAYNRWSEDFYGGDLQGVTDRLDYLQEMGVTALYLNPIFLAPSNHKYDTTSFETVDPRLGGDAALQALLTQAQVRGMRVILDGVFNHTSSDSIYFDKYSRYANDGAYESTSSPYYPWYTFNTWPDNYASWWGYDTLPTLRGGESTVRAYFWGDGLASIGGRWVVSGTAGWRLDVGGDLDHGTQELGGNDYWEGFRQTVKAASVDAVILGEEWGDATPWLLGQEWDAVMNYRFRSALLSFMRDRFYWDNDNNDSSSGGTLQPITVSEFDRWLRQIQEDYPPEAWYAMMNLLGSHDTNRLRFVLSKWQKGYDASDPQTYDPATDLTVEETDQRQKLVALLQFTLPGAPTIYYGDEVGIDAPAYWANNKWEDDPYNRVPFPWDDTPGHYQARPAVQETYARLAQIRAAHPALRSGAFETLLVDDADQIYVYRRSLGEDWAVVVINRDVVSHTVTVDLDGALDAGTTLSDTLHGGGPYTVSGDQTVTVTVEPLDGRILIAAPTWTVYLPIVLRVYGQ